MAKSHVSWLFGGCLVVIILFCAGPLVAQKKLRLEDFVYEEQIRSIMVHQAGTATGPLRPAASPLQQQRLVLEFDDIQESYTSYFFRLQHCTLDWQPSALRDLDYLTDFNEFPINQYTFSDNTHLPYVHYTAALPAVKLPGNYLLVVYRDGNREDLILTRRLLVYENRINVVPLTNFAGAGTLQEGRQPLNFVVNYGSLQVINPPDMIRVVVRQNYRWDNALFNPQATFVRDNAREIEYRFFDFDNSFPAGNEFRFVDFRSLIAPGQHVQRINRTIKPYEVYVMPDGSREGQAYAQYRDLNGQFIVDNRDFPEPTISSNYVFLNFFLKSPQLPDPIFVVGQFNQYTRTKENEMVYSRTSGGYEASILLKQGLYNYQYVTGGTNPNRLEGDRFETENSYDVLVYYRSIKPFSDLLLGYATWSLNTR